MYLAQDDAGVRVVLKVLAAPQRNQGLFDPKIADEASAYARLAHPNIVKVVDLFSTDGRFVVALEFVEGASLSVTLAALKRAGASLDDGSAVYIGVSMFAAIAAAHEARDDGGRPAPVLHRNVNPGNLLIGWDGTIKLGNFNIADVSNALRDSNPGFTWGSYGYFAPERVKQQVVGIAADVYSASLVLWELLAGRKAIDSAALTDAQILEAMANPNVPSLDVVRPHLDARVRNALRTGLQVDPANRSITAAQMRDVLAQTIHGATQRKRLRSVLEQARPEAQSVRSSRVPAALAAPASVDLLSLPPSLPPSSAMVVSSRDLLVSNVPVPPAAGPATPAPSPSPLTQTVSNPAPVVAADPWAAPARPAEQELHAHELLAAPVSAPAGQRTTVAVVLGGVIVFAAAAIALVMMRGEVHGHQTTGPAVPTASATAAPPAPVMSAISDAPPAAAPSASASVAVFPPDRGQLTFPPSAAGHRVFVDGSVVGDGAQPATVRCGPHEVRIGSAGSVQHVNVPCGGTLTMTAR